MMQRNSPRILTAEESAELFQLKIMNPDKFVWGSINMENDQFTAHAHEDSSVMYLAAVIGFDVWECQGEEI